jgi:periplasmic protein TonB
MRKTWLGGAVSLAAHAGAIAAVLFAQNLFRENPVTVIDFSLEKTALPEPEKDTPPPPPVIHKPRPVDKKDVFPDTAKADAMPPAPPVDSESAATVAEQESAPPGQSANIVDSTVLKKEYVTEQYGVIRDKVYRALSYPAYAQEEGWQGTVRIGFLVNRDGTVDSVRVLKSSGYNLLDNNAVKAVRQATPFPHAPGRLQIVLPVVYRLE